MRRSILMIVASAGLACGQAAVCTDAQAGEALVKTGDRVAIFGDSISTGKGYGFVAVQRINDLHPHWSVMALDHGHPGWRADHATNAVDQVLADKPALVTIMFGTNDLGQEGARGVAELRARLKKLVDRFQEAGIRVVLLTPPYTSADRRWGASLDLAGLPRMGEEVFALGAEEGVPVFDMFGAMQRAEREARAQDPAFMMFSAPGDCHPNAAGHALMGQALAAFLLGDPGPARTPFAWTYSGQPAGRAVKLAQPPPPGPEDWAFAGAEPMVLERAEQALDPEAWTGPTDLAARAVAAWDEQALYVQVSVTDDVVLPGEKSPAWGWDGIEFFVDTRPRGKRDVAYAPGYFQMLVAVAAQDGATAAFCGSMDTLDAAAVKAWSRRTEGGYVLRFALPWEQLRVTPQPGLDIGLDFAVNDRDDPAKDRSKALWRGAGDDYTSAGSLGALTLAPR